MSAPWRSAAGSRPGKWSVWKFNWLVNHKIIAALERARPHAHGLLVDVGCGSKAFAPVLEPRVARYLGVDWARPPGFARERGPDVLARVEALPFRDASVDTVFGMSLLTFLPEPHALLEEARRVVRPDGALILEFTQMAPRHQEPEDFFCFTRNGARRLLERADFTPVEFIPIGGLWTRVGLSVIAAVNRVNRGPWRVVTEIPARLLYVVFQLGFALLDLVFHDPADVLAYLVVARPAPRGAGR
jgi:SAM-dependent methyltransferase